MEQTVAKLNAEAGKRRAMNVKEFNAFVTATPRSRRTNDYATLRDALALQLRGRVRPQWSGSMASRCRVSSSQLQFSRTPLSVDGPGSITTSLHPITTNNNNDDNSTRTTQG